MKDVTLSEGFIIAFNFRLNHLIIRIIVNKI